jgi:hypothetical protein
VKLSIRAAQNVCEAAGARQVIVLAFDGSEFSVVSYGATKRECAAVRPLCDEIANSIEAGTLRAPPTGELR